MELEEVFDSHTSLERLEKQFWFVQPEEAYELYQFLLPNWKIKRSFQEFLFLFQRNNGDTYKTLAEFLEIPNDLMFQYSIGQIRNMQSARFNMFKSETDLKFELVDGDKSLYDGLTDCLKFGLTKSVEKPGKFSERAFFIKGDSGEFFVKPVDSEAMAKSELLVSQLAEKFGLSQYFLKTALVKDMSGKYATINPLLPKEFMSLQDFEKKEPGSTWGFMEKFIESGEAHKLALFDLLIKNGDRNKGNIFFDGSRLVLIDNGLAFNSKYTHYIPGYLRKNKDLSETPECKNLQKLHDWAKNHEKELTDAGFSLESRLDKQINERWEALVGKNEDPR